MFRAALVACLVVVALASPIVNVEKEWTNFKQKFNRVYENAEVEANRLRIFTQNLEDIVQHNQKYAKGEFTWYKGVNQFTDMTEEEFHAIYKPNALPKSAIRRGEPHVNSTAPKAVTLDWRTEGYVTPVKDQGQCGACWSFSATGSIEGQWYRSSGRLVSLSEQNLIDCTKVGATNGCNGGLMEDAFTYVAQNGGIDTEASYPYQAANHLCRYSAANAGASIKNYRSLAVNTATVTNALASEGPISCPIFVGVGGFPQSYSGGVYVNANCRDSLNHAILLVGYGTDASAGDYFIVKNSWGTSWGENGYFRIARGNTCGLLEDCTYPVV